MQKVAQIQKNPIFYVEEEEKEVREEEEKEVREEEEDHHHHQTRILQGMQAMAQTVKKSLRAKKQNKLKTQKKSLPFQKY